MKKTLIAVAILSFSSHGLALTCLDKEVRFGRYVVSFTQNDNGSTSVRIGHPVGEMGSLEVTGDCRITVAEIRCDNLNAVIYHAWGPGGRGESQSSSQYSVVHSSQTNQATVFKDGEIEAVLPDCEQVR